MSDILERIHEALIGSQPPADWKSILMHAQREIQYLEIMHDTLLPPDAPAVYRLSAISPHRFRVGETVTAWRVTSSSQYAVEYGEGDGYYMTGKILRVDFHTGGYVYDMEGIGNVAQHLVQKAGTQS